MHIEIYERTVLVITEFDTEDVITTSIQMTTDEYEGIMEG